MARSANRAVSSEAASFPEKPASITRFRPCPSTSTQPAATTSVAPATAMRRRYGQRKRITRASWRISRLGGRSGMLSMRRAKRSSSTQAPFQRHDPMPHRRRSTGREMYLAADIGGEDLFGLAGGEGRKLVPLQLRGQLGLQDRIRARGTAAQVRIWNGRQLESRAREHALCHAFDVLPVLEGAGWLKCDSPALFHGQRFEACILRIDHLADVARHRADFFGFPGVRRIVPEDVRVLLHPDAAAARGHDDGFDPAAFDRRPPTVDQRAHNGQAVVLVGEVVTQRAAAAGAFRFEERNADAVEYPRSRRIDVGCERALHAPCESEHLAGVARRGPGARRGRRGRHFFGEALGKERPRDPAEREEWPEQGPSRQDFGEEAALETLPRGPRGFLLDQLAPDVEQATVLHPRRTGRLASAAGEAAVQVQARLVGDLLALERLLHEVDAPARAVVLVPEQ